MLAGDIYAPRQIRLIDAPEPKLERANGDESGQIIFQPELACLCGSDLPFFEREYEDCLPSVGQSLHEMIGTVVETSGRRFKAGDRVLCVPVEHFGLYERFRISENNAIPLDPRPPEDHAVVAQPLGTVIYALRKIPYLMDLNVAVVGQGPMGQLFCAALRNVGAREIIAIDPLADRLKVSPRMGATATIDPTCDDPVEAIREITNGAMADLVIEVVGHRHQALNLCTDLCRKEGTILYFGVPPTTIDDVQWRKLFLKNINVQTSVGPDFNRDFPLAMRWVAEGRIDVSPIITHRFPLDQIQTAFETFADRRDGALKVFIDFPSA